MKFIKRFTALMIVMVFCLTMFAACVDPNNPPPGPVADSETRPLTMSIQNPDRLFNPFFSTSAMDSTIIGMTQVSMLTSTKDGEPKCGDDEPVVVKDYKIKEADDKSYTDYSFIIKNGIKFSDGEPLTIKDVLFNLYVYLDPVYTGSATIYSTDIVGLQSYRQQDEYATEDGASAFEDGFIVKARQRISRLITFVQAYGIYNPPASSGLTKPSKDQFTADEVKAFQNDVAYVAKEFRKELESDWNNASVESYKDEGFTEKWQVYLYQDAQVDFYQKDATGKYIKDEKGNKQVDTDIVAECEKDLDEALNEKGLEKNETNIREWAINYAYTPYFVASVVSGSYDESVFGEDKIAKTIESVRADQFALILSSWMTANTVQTQFVADAKSEQLGGADHPIKTISGITSSLDVLDKVTEDFHGNALSEPHDILKIRINGIDPKAIWNFSFNVAPMHYYSGEWNGHDYVKEFDAKEGNFGFKFSDKKFFEEVLNSEEKVGLPVGAGVYMASTSKGGVAKTFKDFFSDNIVYYERNPYFETLDSSGKGLITNAKIKYFRYKVVETDQVINSITNGDIDIGEPNATPENGKWLDSKGVAHEEVMTSGYGYVGINPRFVPDVAVRRAIMKAMDTQIIKDNYYQDMCLLINRPMSKANWAYPDTATTYSTTYEDKNGNVKTVSYDYDATGTEIEALLESVGYVKGTDGVYSRRLADGSTSRLSYKFTIAGSSVDHPAYSMFVNAANILNAHGFDVKVVTSQQALSDLSAGKLTVWAAAWSSTIDPDMYQVYHKDSNATSVNNWGYPQIKANRTLYRFEANLLEELSELIDSGRETTVQTEREEIYADALDKVMEFAVEFPTYQRNDMTAFNDKLLDRNTMTPKGDLTPYNGLLARIWELNYIQNSDK